MKMDVWLLDKKGFTRYNRAMIERGFRAAERMAEANLARAEEAGDKIGIETARRQLDVVEHLREDTAKRLVEAGVPDITKYEHTYPPMKDEFEEFYQAYPDSFVGVADPLSSDAKIDIEAFGQIAGWDTATRHALRRGGIITPIQLYEKTQEKILGLDGIGGKRWEIIYQTLGRYYEQFREELL